MDIRELRVGNLVHWSTVAEPNNNIVGIVTLICGEGVVLDEKASYPKDDIKPIPLTEEWLLRMGFWLRNEDVKNWNADYANKSQYWVQHHVDFDDYVLYDKNNSLGFSLKHVHTFQNLYYALTEEELKIEEFLSPLGEGLTNNENKD